MDVKIRWVLAGLAVVGGFAFLVTVLWCSRRYKRRRKAPVQRHTSSAMRASETTFTAFVEIEDSEHKKGRKGSRKMTESSNSSGENAANNDNAAMFRESSRKRSSVHKRDNNVGNTNASEWRRPSHRHNSENNNENIVGNTNAPEWRRPSNRHNSAPNNEHNVRSNTKITERNGSPSQRQNLHHQDNPGGFQRAGLYRHSISDPTNVAINESKPFSIPHTLAEKTEAIGHESTDDGNGMRRSVSMGDRKRERRVSIFEDLEVPEEPLRIPRARLRGDSPVEDDDVFINLEQCL